MNWNKADSSKGYMPGNQTCKATNGGVEPVGGTPEKFGEHLHSEIIKWGRVVRESGAKVE
jgi:hypothetical protein